MKKLYYLIVLTLILGLVLSGCLLSNVGQVPTSEQGGISYLTKHTEGDPFVTKLFAGQTIEVGTVEVWNDVNNLYVKYVIDDPTEWCLTETHLHVATSLVSIPQKNGNPIPGKFDNKGEHDCLEEFLYTIPLAGLGTELFIAAHAVVMDMSCYQTAVLYGIERNTGTVYGVDVLTGTSWVEFDITPPPPTTNVGPNGLAYDAQNGRFYYCNYSSTNTLYFWDTEQHIAGSLIGNIADADFYDGKYYYITGPPASDDLYVVEFNSDGTMNGSPVKVADIANNLHGWTFDGDIAIKDGVVYGWGSCTHGYEFFTVNINGTGFSVTTVSYGSSLQLAFGSDGTLYGHRSGVAGEFYVVNTTNGEVSIVTPTPSPVHLYTDCASGMICEPVTETAWGFGLGFPGKNWATYFIYTIQ
jgi:hypothetical protein